MRTLSILLLILASTLRAAEPIRPAVFRGKTLEQWRADLHSPHVSVRNRAATALGLGPFGKSAVPALLEVMKDEDIKSSVLASLLQLGPTSPEAAPALIPLIEITRSMRCGTPYRGLTNRVRVTSVAPSSLPLLLNRVRQNQNVNRGYASTSFLDGVDRSALPLLRNALGDGCSTIRAAAASALESLGNDAAEAVPDLIRALNDESPGVRRNAIDALGRIRSRPDSVPALIPFLLGDEAELAIRALAQLGPKGFGALRQAYHGGSVDLRESILNLIDLAGSEALPLLLEGLGRPESVLREKAARKLDLTSFAVDAHLPQLIGALEDENPKVRACIISTLADVVPPRRDVTLAIARMIMDDTTDVRGAAVAALRQLGRHAHPALPVLLEGLRHQTADIRERCAMMLGEIALPRTDIVQALCEALKDESSDVRVSAAIALGRLGAEVRTLTRTTSDRRAESVVPALLKCLRDSQANVRVAAGDALLKVGHQSDDVVAQLGLEVLDPLARLFRQSGSNARNPAALSLRGLGPRAAPALPSLMLVLYDGDSSVLDAIAAMGPAAKRAIPALERMLDRTTETGDRRRIAFALLQAGGDGPGIVRARLERQDTDLTLGLLFAVEEAGPAAKVFRPEVLRLTQDPHYGVRSTAIDCLRSMGATGEDVCEALIRALRDEEWSVQYAACEALGKMGSGAKRAVPAMLDLLVHHHPRRRLTVVEALGRIGSDDKDAFAALVETLTDPDGWVRKTAVDGLRGAGRQAVPVLRRACNDSDDCVRLAAACALSGMDGNRELVSRLMRSVMLDSKHNTVRVEACLALWKLERTREVVPVLAQILRDAEARLLASDALCKLDGAQDDVRAFLKPLLKHERRYVRLAAWNVLEKISPELTAALANPR
jgi:HEAT repeat protein